jgi:predicted ArsR family transcriptional regulator
VALRQTRPGPRRRPRKRAPRGQRREQFLAAVSSKPGSTATELGKEIGISTNQAYALGQRLLKDGEVKKSGKGLKAT